MENACTDSRIGLSHITLYSALLCRWYQKDKDRLYIFSHELMLLSKLARSATYHRSIRQLDEYGYIRYVASYNHCLGSLVYLKNM